MSFCSTIYGNLPESGFVYTATTVSVDNGSFENLSATNATIVNLETTTFNPTNVDCTTLTATDATITNISGTNATIDNLEVTNFDITTLEATTANISTINSSTINSSHSNLSTIGTFRINISEASDPALASVIRRDANNVYFEGRHDPTDPSARFFFYPAEEAPGVPPCIINLSNVSIPNISGVNLCYVAGTIDNLSSSNITASGAIDAFSMEATLLTATSNLATPFVNTSELQTQLINSSQVNASNISTRNLSAVLQITSTYIDATNRMSAPTLNTLVNNVSIVNASTINSQIGNFSTTNIINNNVSSVFVKRSTGGKATIDMTTTQVLDIDGGFLDAGNVTARGITLRAGNDVSPAISVGNDNGVVITNLSSVNFETDNMTTDIANATTGNVSTLNVSTLNASVKNATTMNASTINCSTINSSFCNSFSMDTSIITSKIYQLEDASGGGGADGVISESSNVLTIRTGASGGITKFGTTTGGNFSVQIANDALNASTINCSQINATDIDATTIDADTITGDIGGNLAAGTGISLSTAAGVTTISNTGGSVTDPLNLSKLNVSNVSGGNLSMSHGTFQNTMESAVTKTTILELKDGGGGGAASGFISETSNEMSIRTGATGGVIRFGTTYAGNFSVNIAGDALNASTANISIANIKTANISTINSSTGNIQLVNASVINSDFLNGSIANNLAAGTNITLSTVAGVTTINSTGGGVTDPLNVSVINLSTLNGLTSNISTINASIFTSNNGYNMVGSNATNSAGGIGSAFGNSAAFGHVSKVLGTNTYAISQTSGGKTFLNCDPTQEVGIYHGGSEKITITATEVDVRQPINMSTSNTSTSNALVANMSQANASNMSLINLSADLITGDISPNLIAGTGIGLSTALGVTTINNTATGTSVQYGWCVSSTLTGTQTLGSGTILQFDTLSGQANRDFESPTGATNYSTTGYYYEVAVAGYYSVGFNLYTLNTETTAITAVVKDVIGARGTYLTIGESGQDTRSNEDCKMIAYFDVGDRIYVRSSTGIVLNWVNSATFFYGFLLAGSSQLSTSQQYYFRATSNNGGNQAITSATTLDYNVITYDVPANNYDTTNKRYVVPVAGTWQFFFQAYQNSSVSTGFRLGIYKNGTKQVQTGGSVANSERCGVILECAVDDYIDVKGAAGSANVFMDYEYSWFEGYLLQPENNTITTSTDLTTNSLTTSTTNVSNSNISNLTIDNNLNGYAFIRTICIAKVLANGTNVKTIGCTISRSNTGRYGCVLDVARPSSDYCVQLTVMEDNSTLDDVIIQLTQGSMGTTGFLYVIQEQDNGGSPGTYRDRNHFVTVFDTD